MAYLGCCSNSNRSQIILGNYTLSLLVNVALIFIPQFRMNKLSSEASRACSFPSTPFLILFEVKSCIQSFCFSKRHAIWSHELNILHSKLDKRDRITNCRAFLNSPCEYCITLLCTLLFINSNISLQLTRTGKLSTSQQRRMEPPEVSDTWILHLLPCRTMRDKQRPCSTRQSTSSRPSWPPRPSTRWTTLRMLWWTMVGATPV